MPHPIFDVSPFAVNRPEAQALMRELLRAFVAPAAINIVYRRVAADLEPLNLAQQPRLIWQEALDNLAIAGYLERFCEDIRGELPSNRVFQQAVAGVFAAPSDVDRSVLRNGVLVVDRVSLRKLISSMMVTGSPVVVLLIRGEKKTGKSHGHYLFDAAAREVGAQPVYIGPGMAATVDELFTQVFSALGSTKQIPPKLTTNDAWYGVVCGRLLELAMDKNKRLWVAVDDLGFDENGITMIDEEIRNFCNKFALNMQAPQYQDWFRLMLIHYPDTTPTLWPDPIWEADILGPNDIQLDHVIDFLRGWSRERKKRIAAARLTTLSSDLLAKVDGPPAPGEIALPRLQRLYAGLTALTQQLEKP
jgi:hypothetical protein